MSILAELRRRWILVVLAAVALTLLFGQRLAVFITDVQWFASVGYAQVFWTVLTSRVAVGVGAGLLLALIVGANLLLARRIAPTYRLPSAQEEAIERYRELLDPIAKPLLVLVALAVGVLSGISASRDWELVQVWLNRVPFGETDPQFGRDLSYFVFELPFLNRVNGWLFSSLLLVIALCAVVHYVFGGIRPQSPGQKITPAVSVHLSILLAALVAVRAWGFVLDQYMLSYSQRGPLTGLSYTDVNAQLLAYQLLAWIAAACVVLFLVNVRFRGYLLPVAGVALLVIAGLVLAGIYPAAVQRFQVAPQERAQEGEYIERHLEMTRFGFGLDDVQYEQFDAGANLDAADVVENRTTLESVRLWDPATLQNTYKQLQEFRPYYDFRDVDVDRYVIEDELQQVMIGVREYSERDLPANARTWENERLLYTHGYGLVSSDVTLASNQGQPVFLVNNIPPTGVEKLEVDNPRIYFGEEPPLYSVVNAAQDELDFPTAGGQFERYRYTGEDGVAVGGFGRRLLFALRYAEPNFLLSNLITEDSRVLFNRNVRDRVLEVAPFLQLDHDPYPAVIDGELTWILDGYTISDMLPYSERVSLEQLTVAEQRQFQLVPTEDGDVDFRERVVELPGLVGTANYIRNSVKVTVDAYDGTITLYAMDPDDPVLATWRNIFPDLVTDLEDASESLVAHFRYPEDMFRVQAEVFRDYHIEDPEDFYTREDAWNIPVDAAFANNQSNDTQSSADRTMRPYYLLMRLPGEEEEEFALIQPYTPAERPNLIAWLAGRSDGDSYGQLRAYTMPPDRTVFGPQQVQTRIDQDGSVVEQITLWNNAGSAVIYGNLLVIPVEDSLMYVQPLFLRARGEADLPELRRVVIVYGDNVVMAEDLNQGLAQIFPDAQLDITLPDGIPEDQLTEIDEAIDETELDDPDSDATLDPRVMALLDAASEAFVEADEALRDGDLSTYQERTREAQDLIGQAITLMGGTPAVDESDIDDGSADGDDDVELDDPDAGLPEPSDEADVDAVDGDDDDGTEEASGS